MKNATILLAVLAMLAVPAFAQTHVWDGNDDLDGGDCIDWHDPLNWDMDTVPSSTNDEWPIIETYGTVDNPLLIKTGNTADPDKLCLGAYGDAVAHLELQAGGALTTKWQIEIGYAGSTDIFTTFTQKGGAVASGVADENATEWGPLCIGHGAKGRYTISGGTLTTNAGELTLGEEKWGDGGVGEFIIDCSAGGPTSIITNGYLQMAGSTLEFRLDDDGDALAITVATANEIVGDVDLAGTLLLTGTRASTDPLVLMTYTGTLTGAFDSEPAGWDISYTGGQVTATIPEPATMVLLGIGGIGVLIRRRRK